MRRKITKEEFKRVLDTLFPWGYTGDVEKWDSYEYFLGWAYINEDSSARDVMCVNVDAGGVVFQLLRHVDVTFDMVTGAIEGMMHAVLPGMLTDGIFSEECHVIMYRFPEADDDEEKPAMTDKEMMVRDIVQEILDKDELDENAITEVLLDDGCECIHVTFTGAVSVSTIAAVGHVFGDSNPHVYSVGDDAVRLVFSNNLRDELKS